MKEINYKRYNDIKECQESGLYHNARIRLTKYYNPLNCYRLMSFIDSIINLQEEYLYIKKRNIIDIKLSTDGLMEVPILYTKDNIPKQFTEGNFKEFNKFKINYYSFESTDINGKFYILDFDEMLALDINSENKEFIIYRLKEDI